MIHTFLNDQKKALGERMEFSHSLANIQNNTEDVADIK